MKTLCYPLALLGLAVATTARAIDLEAFEFNEPDGTFLTATANSANPGNNWSYAEEATTPGDWDTGDNSSVQGGSYQIRSQSDFAAGLESRFLDIDNVTSGSVYMSVTFSSWDFQAYDGSSTEQFRITFLNDDTGTSGSSVTAQAQIRRNTETGAMELVGDSIGTAGSFDIDNTVELPATQSGPFTLVLGLDEDSDSFEVFYKDGSSPSQVLGLGGVSRVRDANSIRMVTGTFGVGSFPDFNLFTDEVNVDRFAISDTNPLTDLVTLEIDRTTGEMLLKNTSGAAVSGVTSVTLESGIGAVDPAEFVDFSGTLAIDQEVALSTAAGAWVQHPIEDLRAELNLSGGGVRTVDVNFVGGDGKWTAGDLDFDGDLDADDYAVLAANAESDLAGLTLAQTYQLGDLNSDGANDVSDFSEFKSSYIDLFGAPAFALLVAGIPEPATGLLALLASVGAVGFGGRKRVGGFLALLAAVAMLAGGEARAAHLEDFTFDDPAGTSLFSVANSANPGNTFEDGDADNTDVATDGFGFLDATLKTNTNFGTSYVDVDPSRFTGDLIYGVMELTWDMTGAFNSAEPEQVRISLINSDPRSTEITAEFRIQRASDGIFIEGRSGAGQTLAPVTLNEGSLTQSDTFIAIVAADLSNDTHEVFYSSNAGGSFTSLGTGAGVAGRGVESMRLTLNNDLSNSGILIDRVYLTEDLGFELDPALLKLQVHPVSGAVSIVNDSTATFDIDHYRLTSGDGSLDPSSWYSLQDQGVDAIDGPDGGSTAGDGSGETWTEAGGSDTTVLSESFLLSSTILEPDAHQPLGGAFDLSGDAGQLTFEYRLADTGSVIAGEVLLAAGLDGDFNLDGVVDAADYVVYRNNASGLFTPAHLAEWKANYGATASNPATATSVPEPGALALLLAAACGAVRLRC